MSIEVTNSSFAGTREAQEFHQPGPGFFSLTWRSAATKREAERVELVLADIADYDAGRMRLSHALASCADVTSVDERVQQLRASIDGKPRTVLQRSYPLEQLPVVLDALTTRSDFAETDFWLGQNGFSKPNRRAPNVVHLNMLFVDLDVRAMCHRLAELTPEKQAEELVTWCVAVSLPVPSFITWSGNGLHLKWLLDQPAPRAAKPLWDALQLHLVGHFKKGGWPVDEKARDVSRILRIPGTFNQKGGELCRLLWVNGPDLEDCLRYDFNELADGKTVMPWSRAEARAHKEVARVWDANRAIAKSVADLFSRPDVAVGKFLEAELWHKRLSAIRRLVELRYGTGGVPEGQRNNFAWLAANALAWSASGADAYYRDLLPVVREIAPTLSHRDVLASASSVSRRLKEAAGQGTGLYKMTNERFREALSITEAEASNLFESHKPRPDWDVGVMGFPLMANLPFDEYVAETKRRQAEAGKRSTELTKGKSRKTKKAALLERALMMRAGGASQPSIATALGVTQQTVSNWLREHDKELA